MFMRCGISHFIMSITMKERMHIFGPNILICNIRLRSENVGLQLYVVI